MPAPADFDGDCLDDLIIYRRGTVTWQRYDRVTGQLNWQLAPSYPGGSYPEWDSRPTPLDLDDDGVLEFGIFEPNFGRWHFFNQQGGYVTEINTNGSGGETPISLRFDHLF